MPAQSRPPNSNAPATRWRVRIDRADGGAVALGLSVAGGNLLALGDRAFDGFDLLGLTTRIVAGSTLN